MIKQMKLGFSYQGEKREILIDVVYSGRSTLGLEVSRNGQVKLRAPRRVSDGALQNFARQKEAWIIEKYLMMEEKRKAESLQQDPDYVKDPALEQAVRFLPGQKRAFCIPYCLFIFLCNMTADVVFLCSWQIRIGGVTGTVIVTAVIFALQSAIGSVLLEWLCPIRGWKTESDLWHHPRNISFRLSCF